MPGRILAKMSLLATALSMLAAGSAATADSVEVIVTADPVIGSGYAYRPPTFSTRTVVVREPAPRVILQDDDGRTVVTRDRRLIDLSRRGGIFFDREVIVLREEVVRQPPLPEVDPIGRPGSVVNLLKY